MKIKLALLSIVIAAIFSLASCRTANVEMTITQFVEFSQPFEAHTWSTEKGLVTFNADSALVVQFIIYRNVFFITMFIEMENEDVRNEVMTSIGRRMNQREFNAFYERIQTKARM
jgi:hypothetical protein